jgi:hypothetical protein
VMIERDGHLLELYRYLALNPVRAGLCRRPERWTWGSYARRSAWRRRWTLSPPSGRWRISETVRRGPENASKPSSTTSKAVTHLRRGLTPGSRRGLTPGSAGSGSHRRCAQGRLAAPLKAMRDRRL